MTTNKENKAIIQIPDGIQVTIENSTITISGEKGTTTKTLTHPKIKFEEKNKTIQITCSSTRRKELALLGTFIAHIKNMIKGVSVGFEYHMKTVFSHFPIKTSVQDNKFIIENFLGERSPRAAKILENVTVEVKGENVTVKGIDKEKVGQTVANIERAGKVKKRDIRIFQDGVYLIK